MRLIATAVIILALVSTGLVSAQNLGEYPLTRFSCSTLKGLQEAFNNVVNEQQIRNANEGSDIWTVNTGCRMQYAGRTFIYDGDEAARRGVWKSNEVGLWGWLLQEDGRGKFMAELWRTAHPREVVKDHKGKEKNLGDDVRWTLGAIYRFSNARLSPMCMRRVVEKGGVKIYGHQLGHGNRRDYRQSDRCAQPPEYWTGDSPVHHPYGRREGKRDLPLTPEQIYLRDLLRQQRGY